jgi:tRNA U34 5-methylaminomethyl-2-thiouridine-forming methyltransferase MnmC
MDVTFHSRHGAIQESMHVYIEAGFRHARFAGNKPLHIFEMGFGTGLNVLLTAIDAADCRQPVYYETIDAFPLGTAAADSLNYCTQMNRPDLMPLFRQIHHSGWNEVTELHPFFRFKKERLDMSDWLEQQTPAPGNAGIDLVYFDAFSPDIQPELWTSTVFAGLYALMAPGGILVTYCSKTVVRRAMQEAGLQVEKISGPYGKREMLRAVKGPGV